VRDARGKARAKLSRGGALLLLVGCGLVAFACYLLASSSSSCYLVEVEGNFLHVCDGLTRGPWGHRGPWRRSRPWGHRAPFVHPSRTGRRVGRGPSLRRYFAQVKEIPLGIGNVNVGVGAFGF